MPKNNPWEHLSSQPTHVSLTYGKIHQEGSMYGKHVFVVAEDIQYVREYRDNDGSVVMLRDASSGRMQWHTVLESVDEILEQMGQKATTHAENSKAGTMPESPLPPTGFVTATFANGDENHTGARIAFRLTAPSEIREPKTGIEAGSFVSFLKPGEGNTWFLLKETPGQLFELSGRKAPVSARQKREAEKAATPPSP